jgi:hypothetical protein
MTCEREFRRKPKWDDDSIADLLAEAMQDVHDMDTGYKDFAKAAVRALREEGLLSV